MVVFLDLEDDAEPPEHWLLHNATVLRKLDIGDQKSEERSRIQERQNPNKDIAATRALGCYPIIREIACHLDLNSLDGLSMTCRQVRANLLQFRNQLINSTLRCENEDIEPDPEHTFRYRARAADWYFVEAGRDAGSGKVGQCARDLVGGCRKCGKVICRNCTIKPPAPVLLRYRHRRICSACSRTPLSSLAQSTSSSPNFETLLTSPVAITTLNPDVIKRSICTCPTAGVWLCQPCGRSVRSDDIEYESIWKWRTRYLPSLGGLGTGIGEGNRGVPCGRAAKCVAAREVEQEIDCDAEDAREIDNNSRSVTPSSSPTGSLNGGGGSGQMGPGYARHEIEGIGGVVKRKLVRMVKIGHCVPEWNEEKAAGRFLVREQEGRARSWCGWCERPIPSAKDNI